MKITAGVEWAVHCCVVLATAEAPVPTQRLAQFHDVSRSYLAKNLQQLSSAGLITATEGRDGGYRLTRPASDITLLDIVIALEGSAPAFRCTEVRARGPVPASPADCARPCEIARAMHNAEQAYRQSLAAVTIQSLSQGWTAASDPARVTKIREWFGGSVA